MSSRRVCHVQSAASALAPAIAAPPAQAVDDQWLGGGGVWNDARWGAGNGKTFSDLGAATATGGKSLGDCR